MKGYLKAIKFVQTELGNSNFARPLVLKLLAQVLDEGMETGGGMFLLWKWRQKIHLGALHGITGYVQAPSVS